MKKIILVASLMILCFSMFAQNILDFSFSFEAGYMPFDRLILRDSFNENNQPLYIKLDFELQFIDNHFFIGGYFNTKLLLSNTITNSIPYLLDYQARLGFRYNGFEIGFRHNCYHPIVDNGVQNTSLAIGGYEEIYISFKGNINIF